MVCVRLRARDCVRVRGLLFIIGRVLAYLLLFVALREALCHWCRRHAYLPATFVSAAQPGTMRVCITALVRLLTLAPADQDSQHEALALLLPMLAPTAPATLANAVRRELLAWPLSPFHDAGLAASTRAQLLQAELRALVVLLPSIESDVPLDVVTSLLRAVRDGDEFAADRLGKPVVCARDHACNTLLLLHTCIRLWALDSASFELPSVIPALLQDLLWVLSHGDAVATILCVRQGAAPAMLDHSADPVDAVHYLLPLYMLLIEIVLHDNAAVRALVDLAGLCSLASSSESAFAGLQFFTNEEASAPTSTSPLQLSMHEVCAVALAELACSVMFALGRALCAPEDLLLHNAMLPDGPGLISHEPTTIRLLRLLIQLSEAGDCRPGCAQLSSLLMSHCVLSLVPGLFHRLCTQYLAVSGAEGSILHHELVSRSLSVYWNLSTAAMRHSTAVTNLFHAAVHFSVVEGTHVGALCVAQFLSAFRKDVALRAYNVLGSSMSMSETSARVLSAGLLVCRAVLAVANHSGLFVTQAFSPASPFQAAFCAPFIEDITMHDARATIADSILHELLPPISTFPSTHSPHFGHVCDALLLSEPFRRVCVPSETLRAACSDDMTSFMFHSIATVVDPSNNVVITDECLRLGRAAPCALTAGWLMSTLLNGFRSGLRSILASSLETTVYWLSFAAELEADALFLVLAGRPLLGWLSSCAQLVLSSYAVPRFSVVVELVRILFRLPDALPRAALISSVYRTCACLLPPPGSATVLLVAETEQCAVESCRVAFTHYHSLLQQFMHPAFTLKDWHHVTFQAGAFESDSSGLAPVVAVLATVIRDCADSFLLRNCMNVEAARSRGAHLMQKIGNVMLSVISAMMRCALGVVTHACELMGSAHSPETRLAACSWLYALDLPAYCALLPVVAQDDRLFRTRTRLFKFSIVPKLKFVLALSGPINAAAQALQVCACVLRSRVR